jgi:Secretion system C-terminal sorting domain/PKD-like domain
MKKVPLLLIVFMLLAGLAFLPATSWAQPSFVTPVTCIPANPASASTTYTINANGTTIASIGAVGDLEIVSTTPATFPTTSNVTVVVRSRNFGRNITNDCIGYLALSSAQNFGFGKGRLRVSYVAGVCGSSIDLDIYKSFTQTPPIIGPKCIAIGDTVTYSVCPILSVNQNSDIGIDSYVWTLPANVTALYASGDSSSITFKVGPSWTGGNITCKLGRCNTIPSSLTIGIKTQAPASIVANGITVTNNSTICVGTNLSAINLVATAPAGSGYSYSWSTNNPSWGFGSAPTTTSASGATVALTINESKGSVYLTTIGGCGSRIDTFNINRGLAAPLVIKRTDALACVVPGTATPFTFTVNNAANTANVGNLNFTWTVPAGWTIQGLATGSTINVLAGSGAVGGNVTATSNGCTGTLSLPVNVRPATPSAITGPNCITLGSTAPLTYSVTNVPPLTYTWTNTAVGWTTPGSTTNSITYTPNGTTVGTISVVANSTIAGAGTCPSNPVTRVINFLPAPPTGVTGIPTCIPGGTPACNITLTASGGSGGYVWTIPAALGTPASFSGNPVTIATTGTPGTYNVQVVCNNACGNSTVFTQAVTIAPAATLSYIQGGTFDLISVTNPPGSCAPVSYCWRLNGTGSCIGTGQNILLQSGGAASYTVDITYANGCVKRLTQTTRFSGLRAGRDNNIAPEPAELRAVTISPNPAGQWFTLELPASITTAQVSVYNGKGAMIHQQNCTTRITRFDTNNWANGEYIVLIQESNGQFTTRKIVVKK